MLVTINSFLEDVVSCKSVEGRLQSVILHKFLLLLTLSLTTVSGVRHFAVSVILSVYLHNKTKTAEPKIAKLVTWIVHHDTSHTD